MDDLEFVQKCVEGGRPAWDEFLSKYSRLIYSCIHAVLKTSTYPNAYPENIDDIFQEICFSLVKDNFRKLRSFESRNKCSLAGWLRQISINATIDYLRRSKSFISLDQENDDELSLKDLIADNRPLPEELIFSDEKVSQLKDCIEGLDTDDKYMLELYINHKLSLEELRKHFKVSRGTIDMRKFRIVERLKDCFKRKGFALD